MTDDTTRAEELEGCLDAVKLYIDRLDTILTDIAQELREAKEPTSVSKRAARAELDDLAELDNALRRAKDLLRPPHTDAHNIQADLEERMALLTIPAERPQVSVSGWTFTPVPKRSASVADGFEWTSPEVHEVLRAYGYEAIVKTQPNSQSVLAAVNELKKKHGEHGRLPDVTLQHVNTETGEVVSVTVNLEDVIKINERPSMRRIKGKK